MTTLRNTLPALTALLLLSACGGGGNDNAATDTPTTQPGNTVATNSDTPSQQAENNHSATNPPPAQPSGDQGTYTYNVDPETSPVGSRELYRSVTLSYNGKNFLNLDASDMRLVIDTAVLPQGDGEGQAEIVAIDKNGRRSAGTLPIRSYKGYYSGTFITAAQEIVENLGDPRGVPFPLHDTYYTPTTQLPGSGQTTYSGRAFDINPDHDAALTYHVDFANRKGYGEIAASRSQPRITLLEDRITREEYDGNPAHYQIDSSLRVEGRNQGIGSYSVIFSGPNAEEIIGFASYDDHDPNAADIEMALHATRGELR